MTTWARNVNDQAIDVITTDPATIFHSEVAAQFVEVPDGTENWARLVNGSWVNPPAPPAPSITPVTTVMKAVLWYNCFTPAEALAIKGSADPMVNEFFYRLQQLINAGETIDTGIASAREGVEYLATTMQNPAVSPTNITYVDPARVADILAGVMQ